MSKISRNDACPCGSGKKYKKCCEPREHALAAERARVAKHERDLQALASLPTRIASTREWIAVEDDVDRASNAVVALVRDGRLDEAEQAGLQLLHDYPEVHDGFERLGMVYEKRGDKARAAEMYQRALDFTLHNDGYDEEVRTWYRDKLAELRDGDR